MDAAIDEAVGTVRELIDNPSSGSAPVLDALFRSGARLRHGEVERALSRAGLDALVATGLVRDAGEAVIPTARLTGFGGRLIASDRMAYRNHADFVLGPGPATATLADAVRPIDHGRVLDLGCGPGTLALWLARPGVDVVGMDISDRALAFAAFNRRLNVVPGAAFCRGDFLTSPPDPSLDGRFDVALANPPFVLAPRSELRYRDGPLPGDATTRVALERVQRTLAPGGRGYVIGSWADDARGRWDARPRAWLQGLAVRAIVTRISSVAPDMYARSWTNDLEEASRAGAAAQWLGWLEAQGIRRITTGVIAIARPSGRTWRRGLVAVLETSRPGWRAVEANLA